MDALHCNGRPKVLQDGCIALQWRRGCCNGGWDVAMADGMLQWWMGCCNGGQADAMADGMLQDGRWDVAMVDAWLQW